MTDAIELAQLFDVDVNEFAGMLALVATHRRGRFERAAFVQAQALENAAHRGRRNSNLDGDRFAGQGLTAQRLDTLDNGLRSWPIEPLRPRATVGQTRGTFRAIASRPFAHHARKRLRLRLRPSAFARL